MHRTKERAVRRSSTAARCADRHRWASLRRASTGWAPGDSGPCVPGYIDLCLVTPRTEELTVTSGTTEEINTGTDGRCVVKTQASGPDLCVLYFVGDGVGFEVAVVGGDEVADLDALSSMPCWRPEMRRGPCVPSSQLEPRPAASWTRDKFHSSINPLDELSADVTKRIDSSRRFPIHSRSPFFSRGFSTPSKIICNRSRALTFAAIGSE
jgi:hypothetical protein